MFKKKVKTSVKEFRKKDKNGLPLYLIPVDQFSAQDFNRSATGWPASDISILMRATTDKEFELVAARLQQIKSANPDNKGKSDSQIVSEIMPSWVQSPAELDRFMDYYNKLHPVEVRKNESTPAPEPAPEPAPAADK